MEINKYKHKLTTCAKSLILPALLLICLGNAFAQTMSPLSLDSCYAMAKRNYPLIKKYDSWKKRPSSIFPTQEKHSYRK